MNKHIPLLYRIGKLWIKYRYTHYKITQPIDFESSRTIGIIYCRDNLLTETTIDNLFTQLKKLNKTIYSLEYIPKGLENNYKLKEKNHFSLRNNDINIFGLPKKFIRENFCTNQYDIVLNLSMIEEVFIHNIVEICEGKIKAGFSADASVKYDFILDISNTKDFKQLVETIIHFLEKIKKF